MSNVIIIGSGPAGVSAALYTQRGNIKTTIITNGIGSLAKAEKIENYYGVFPWVSGKELEVKGIESAKALGVEFIEEEVTGLNYTDKLTVTTTNSTYSADAVILATGSKRNTPKIEGLAKYEGKGISYCAVCDAFFYKDKDVAVLGSGNYALSELKELESVAGSVIILTNGEPLTTEIPQEISVITKTIAQFTGTDKLEGVMFDDNTAVKTDGVFIALGTAGSTDLAKKLGAITENNKIFVDENMATNIPGLYAAGDCTGGLQQISKAVYQGAVAAVQVIKLIRNSNK